MRFLSSRWSARPIVCGVVAAITCVWFLLLRSRDVDGAAPTIRARLPIADHHIHNASTRGDIAVQLPVTSTLQLRLKLAGAQPSSVRQGGLQCGVLADFKRARDQNLAMTLYASIFCARSCL